MDIGKARESANEAISRLRPPEEGAWYENNFITRANASVGRAVLGFANDTVLGLAQMVQEGAHKMPLIPGANVYSTGVEAAQQLNEYRIQQENLRLGNTTQEEISAQGKQQLSAMWDGLGEPITKPWNRGDYLEAVARGGLEVGSLLVGVGEATAATKGARAANAANKTAVATRAAETANVANKGAEAANIARGVETANVVKQTAKGADVAQGTVTALKGGDKINDAARVADKAADAAKTADKAADASKVTAAASAPSASVAFDAQKLQAKSKHAADFGVSGNWSKKTASEFEAALRTHLDSPGTTAIQGTYRGDPVTHFFDANTRLNVIVDANGGFVSGWKLSPAQAAHVTTTGKLGGG